MKKFWTAIASVLLSHLCTQTLSPCPSSFAVAQTTEGRAAASTAADSAAIKKAKQSLDATQADIDRFLADQAQKPATSPDSTRSAALSKASTDLESTQAQIERLIAEQEQQETAVPGSAQADLKKAMDALSASAAQLSRFISEQSEGKAASNGNAAELNKTKTDLAATEAEIDKFIKEQDTDASNAPDAAAAAKLHKAMSDLDASSAQINQFLEENQPDAPGQTLQLSSRFGSRLPRKCPAITSAPTPTQAAALVQCTMDYETDQQTKLHQDVIVQIGPAHSPANTGGWPRLDARFPVIDLAVTANAYVCGPVSESVMHNTGSNCDLYKFQAAPGVCWKTVDGSYSCQINAGLPANPTRGQAPPTTY